MELRHRGLETGSLTQLGAGGREKRRSERTKEEGRRIGEHWHTDERMC